MNYSSRLGTRRANYTVISGAHASLSSTGPQIWNPANLCCLDWQLHTVLCIHGLLNQYSLAEPQIHEIQLICA